MTRGVHPADIPNPEVKPRSGDGTRKGRVASRQHRDFKESAKQSLALLCYNVAMSYSPWAKRRKTLYALGLFLLFLAFLIPIVLYLLHEPPTCFDGKQNQGETAPDMGGPCKRLDPRFLDEPKILWVRPLKLRKGYYNAVAYVENTNLSAGAKKVPYIMKFFDDEGVMLTSRAGKTDIYPSMIFPVFEGAIDTDERDVARATFQFTGVPVWERIDELPSNGIKILKHELRKTKHALRLSAVVKNTTIDDKSNIHFVATLFDKDGSALATSHSYLAYLRADKSAEIVFTWPNQLEDTPASVDIIPLIPLE